MLTCYNIRKPKHARIIVSVALHTAYRFAHPRCRRRAQCLSYDTGNSKKHMHWQAKHSGKSRRWTSSWLTYNNSRQQPLDLSVSWLGTGSVYNSQCSAGLEWAWGCEELLEVRARLGTLSPPVVFSSTSSTQPSPLMAREKNGGIQYLGR